jgi:hypothetical protein
MIQLLVTVALVLTAAASSTAQGVSIRFAPESEQFAEAAREYQSLWEAEGDRIIAALEHVTGLQFAEREIQAVVYEGISRAGLRGGPMRMRASYPAGTKKATLIHELGHRHIMQLRWRPSELDEHQVLFLFLYDVWERLYGQEFAEEQVAVEKKRKGVYDYEAAWAWALAQSKEERAQRFKEIVGKNQGGG